MIYSTFGRDIYPDKEILVYIERDAAALSHDCVGKRFRLIHVKEGFGIFSNGSVSQLFTAPSVICANEKEPIEFIDAKDLKADILYFDPSVFNKATTIEEIRKLTDELFGDFWLLRPFIVRANDYIGITRTNNFLSNRVKQLFDFVNEELSIQRDGFWPCRTRSFFIELIILVSSIYDNDDACQKMILVGMNDEVKQVINYIHIHYPEKITTELLTTQFHTNKTTLNQKFKEVAGVTVMEYLNNFRMQLACSFLRKTSLTVNEILERVGFKDDSHFLRAFKKYAKCSPSVYRNNHTSLLFS